MCSVFSCVLEEKRAFIKRMASDRARARRQEAPDEKRVDAWRERPSRVLARDYVKSFRSSYTGLHPQSVLPLRVSRNSGGCYAERTLGRPLPTGPAFESDDGAVTRTQSSRSRQCDTAEEMHDEQL